MNLIGARCRLRLFFYRKLGKRISYVYLKQSEATKKDLKLSKKSKTVEWMRNDNLKPHILPGERPYLVRTIKSKILGI